MEFETTHLGGPVALLGLQGAAEASRRLILEEIGDSPDLTLVRGQGNRGDELIWAGTHQLLVERIYREIELEGLASASGHTVLLSGGGAFCRPYNDLMPRALAVAAMRFERVIVLPSSFDPSDDVVREALAGTRALVFARERESYRRIVSLCDARLALDCAFFFDFAPWHRRGEGTLNAFRTDLEALPAGWLPNDNNDVSVTEASLEDWLSAIADHDLVRTDRAHVMIAAALLGKTVEFAPSSYHKLDAIVDYALARYPVSRLVAPAQPRRRAAPNGRSESRAALTNAHVTVATASANVTRMRASVPRVCAIVLTRDRPDRALKAVDSIRDASVSVQTVMFDNNSSATAAQALADGCAQRDRLQLRRSDRNLGCAGARQAAIDATEGELVLMLDDDAELRPGALDLLVSELDAHPDAAGVTATVESPDRTIQHSGGWLNISAGVAEFSLIGAGQPIEAVPPSGQAGWIPGTAALIRRQVFEQFPLDPEMRAYYEDNEWSYRVELARPGSFRRSREALAVHHITTQRVPGTDFASRSIAVELLQSQARFYERHGLLLETQLFQLVPELLDDNGTPDLAAARLLMELLLAKGPDWTFVRWMNGDLDALLSGSRRLGSQRAATEVLERKLAQHEQAIAHHEQTIAEQATVLTFLEDRHQTLLRILDGGWWRLRARLLPALRLIRRLRGGS